ncbi:hypothetical protein VNI00_018324 [Paramarasmius palmivorus]|uniref:Uncharacterized protein n=1 Tax=Paramarasmius palmivorus TaxID=297713 RepID=A0AAW0B0L4_9AGAR
MISAPASVKLPNIRNQFWNWLDHCAPGWMQRDEKACLLPSGAAGDGDFEALICPGTSGIVLLLVALRWWCDAGGPSDAARFWYEAAKCVHLLLSGLFIALILKDKDEHMHELSPAPSPPSPKSISALLAIGSKQKARRNTKSTSVSSKRQRQQPAGGPRSQSNRARRGK